MNIPESSFEDHREFWDQCNRVSDDIIEQVLKRQNELVTCNKLADPFHNDSVAWFRCVDPTITQSDREFLKKMRIIW